MPSPLSNDAAHQDEAFLAPARRRGSQLFSWNAISAGMHAGLITILSPPTTWTAAFDARSTCSTRGGRRLHSSPGPRPAATNVALAGYLAALHHAGRGRDLLVLEQPAGLATKESYAKLAGRLLAQHADAVVCYQDYTALGLILELLNRGVRVPADVAITGFDNLPIGKAYSIGVTTYAFSPVTVAHQAIRLIRARVAGDKSPPIKVLIPGELIVHESSQPSEPQA